MTTGKITAPAMVIGSKQRAAAVILAAGSGSRMRAAQNKVFLDLCGRRVVSWSVESLARIRAVKRVVLVIREDDRKLARETMEREIDDVEVEIVVGGGTRQQSELFALRHLCPAIATGEINLVLLHDGARPLLSSALAHTVIRAAVDHDAAYPALEADDIRRLRPDGTLDFSHVETMLKAQTPQVFRAPALLNAYEQADRDGFDGSDTVACWERYNTGVVRSVPGDPRNIKITYPEDLRRAEQILREAQLHLT